jgi:hypothetical protein
MYHETIFEAQVEHHGSMQLCLLCKVVTWWQGSNGVRIGIRALNKTCALLHKHTDELSEITSFWKQLPRLMQDLKQITPQASSNSAPIRHAGVYIFYHAVWTPSVGNSLKSTKIDNLKLSTAALFNFFFFFRVPPDAISVQLCTP